MREQSIRAVEADGATGYAGIGPVLCVSCVGCEINGPAVVGTPCQLTALKEQVAGAVVANNKDDVALQPAGRGCQLAEINATEPVFGYVEFNGWIPLAFA